MLGSPEVLPLIVPKLVDFGATACKRPYKKIYGLHKSQANRQQRAGVDASRSNLPSCQAPDTSQVHASQVSSRQDRIRQISAYQLCAPFCCAHSWLHFRMSHVSALRAESSLRDATRRD